MIKKLTFLGLLVIITCFYSLSSAFADTKTTIVITVQREDPGFNPPTSCPFRGTGCTVTTTTTTSSINDNKISFDGNTYFLTSNVGPLEGIVKRDGKEVIFKCEDRALLFPAGTTLTILSSDEYPELAGREIPVDGVTSDSKGYFSIKFVK